MSTPDDTNDPLAGVDLRAWQPPPPPAGQVDAILARVTDATRVDGAPAIDLDDERPSAAPVKRTRWLAIGIAIGAAAAALLMIALWPGGEEPAPAPPMPGITQTGGSGGSGTGSQAKNTVLPAPMDIGKAVATCRAFRDAEEWPKVIACADDLLRWDRQNLDAGGLREQAVREQAARLAIAEVTAAIAAGDLTLARDMVASIPPDSIYYERAQQALALASSDPPAGCDAVALLDEARAAGGANQWSKMLSKAEASNSCKASKSARQLALLASCRLGNRDRALKYWREFSSTAISRQQCAGVVDATDAVDLVPDEPTAGCDAVALLKEAREAGGANQWNKMLQKAEASNRCESTEDARKLALLAACRLDNRAKAKKYWPEFEDSSMFKQLCIGVMPDDGSTSSSPPADPSTCDAAVLIDEAKAAGGANQYSKMLSKAEASNNCSASRSARQLALLAACRLGNRDKAAKYWKEFENNAMSKQQCVGVVP